MANDTKSLMLRKICDAILIKFPLELKKSYNMDFCQWYYKCNMWKRISQKHDLQTQKRKPISRIIEVNQRKIVLDFWEEGFKIE